MFIFQMGQDKIRHIIQNISLLTGLHRKNSVSDIPDGVLEQHDAQSIGIKSQAPQRIVFGDAVIFTVPG